jgi:hypothetical protein
MVARIGSAGNNAAAGKLAGENLNTKNGFSRR